MTTIVVSAIIEDGDRALLARRDDGRWDLPGGLLGEGESTEEALARILFEEFKLRLDGEEFLETYFEGGADGAEPVIRNVYLAPSWTGVPLRGGPRGSSSLHWVSAAEALDLPLGDVIHAALRDGLGRPADAEALPGAPILFLTGPPSAGKSTVARTLCARLARSAYVDVDVVRHMVVSGYASPIPEKAEPLSAAVQNELQLANVAALARNFSLAGFYVVADLAIETPEQLDGLLEALSGLAPVHLVTLLPGLEILRQRDHGRPQDARQSERCVELHALFSANGEVRGLRLDNSRMTAEETATRIHAHLDRARVC